MPPTSCLQAHICVAKLDKRDETSDKDDEREEPWSGGPVDDRSGSQGGNEGKHLRTWVVSTRITFAVGGLRFSLRFGATYKVAMRASTCTHSSRAPNS